MSDDRWADDDPTHLHLLARRDAAVRELLGEHGLWPLTGRRVVDLGCGRGHSGLAVAPGAPDRFVGVDRSAERLARARRRLPGAHLVVGDLRAPPLAPGSADLALLFTVLSSVPDHADRRRIAAAALDTLRPAGSLLVYDLVVLPPGRRSATGSPLRPVSARELRRLFPDHALHTRRVTLAPPLARALLPRSPPLADLLETLPCLRTHRLSLIRPRPSSPTSSSPRRT